MFASTVIAEHVLVVNIIHWHYHVSQAGTYGVLEYIVASPVRVESVSMRTDIQKEDARDTIQRVKIIFVVGAIYLD